jgi:hypothetical protein
MAEDRLSLNALLLRLGECYPLRKDQMQILTDLLEENGVTEEVFTERQAKAADGARNDSAQNFLSERLRTRCRPVEHE